MRSLAAAVLAGALVGCAPGVVPSPRTGPAPVEPPPPVSVTAAEVAALARILQAEDTRDTSVAALAGYLESPSPIVRARAARALGSLRSPDAVPLLAPLVADPDTAVAASAAFALGRIGEDEAVQSLTAAIGSGVQPGRRTVASEAAYALGRIGAEQGRAALRAYLAAAPDEPWRADVTGSALLAIWRFPRDTIDEPVGRWTASADPELRWRAAYALVRRPDPRVTARLRALLDDADERVRATAVRGLTAPLADSSGIGAAALLADLLPMLADPAYPVRINAIGVLGTYRDPAAVAALADRLSSGDAHEVFAAAEALGRIGEAARAAAPDLAAVARDGGAHVSLRAVALDALNRIAPEAAVPVARELASDPGWRLRAASARVLAAAGSTEADRLLRDEDGRVATAAVQAAITAAEDSLDRIRPLLLESLASRDIGVRTAALQALGGLADPAALPALLDAYEEALDDPWNDAALAALDALAALRSPTLDPARAFFTRFESPDDPVLHGRAIERFGDRAISAWGSATPIETGRTPAEYEAVVRRWVVPGLQRTDSVRATIVTDAGAIALRLFGADAPLTVESFARLAEAGFFDGQEWPRVVPNFVVQGGDPRGDTSGGPGYSIRDEITRHRYGAGTLGMALSGPDTGGSQFFITHFPQPHLDGIYAIFGGVVDGFEATRRILPGDAILSIRLSR